MTSWPQLTIHAASPCDAETISDCLLALGADAVTFKDACDDPLYEPELNTTPLWDNVLVQGLFNIDTNLPAIITQLQQQLSKLKWHYTCEQIAESDWQDSWKKHFKPQCFGERLWIVPSWHEAPDPNGINLHLDPGLAFGTGAHPTTQLCLEWLASNDIRNKTVIDYGCGSGILALAAIKLGAKQVIAVDLDPQALEATQINAQRNAISAEQLITVLPHELAITAADVVIANILAQPLIELAATLTQLCMPQGTLVLSGILSEQVPKILNAYQNLRPLKSRATLEEWALVESIS